MKISCYQIIPVVGIFQLTSLFTFSQQKTDVDKNTSAGISGVDFMYTVAGQPYMKTKFSKVVEGSPFFNEDFMTGAIILSGGREYKYQQLRLNLLDLQVNFLDEKQNELVATTPVREVVLWDTLNKKDYRFVLSDFIHAVNKPEKSFYELQQTGKAELYKQHKKLLVENQPYGQATIEQKIFTRYFYFVYSNGKWTRIKKLKDLPDALSDKKNELLRFISENKLSGDNEYNYQRVMTFYNGLHMQ